MHCKWYTNYNFIRGSPRILWQDSPMPSNNNYHRHFVPNIEGKSCCFQKTLLVTPRQVLKCLWGREVDRWMVYDIYLRITTHIPRFRKTKSIPSATSHWWQTQIDTDEKIIFENACRRRVIFISNQSVWLHPRGNSRTISGAECCRKQQSPCRLWWSNGDDGVWWKKVINLEPKSN